MLSGIIPGVPVVVLVVLGVVRVVLGVVRVVLRVVLVVLLVVDRLVVLSSCSTRGLNITLMGSQMVGVRGE